MILFVCGLEGKRMLETIDKFYLLKGKQWILVGIDVLIVAVCCFLSLMLRFDFSNVPREYVMIVEKTYLIDACITVFVFWIFKLYHSIWAFASINELARVFFSSAVVVIIEIAYKMMFKINMPRSYYVTSFMTMVMLAGGVRISLRIYRYFYKRKDYKAKRINTMIVGAGSACSMLIREFSSYNNSQNRVVCIVDDNPWKKGKNIRGISIIGGRNQIEKAVNTYKIDEIIIAMPAVSKANQSKIIEICNTTNCRVKILPYIESSLTGKISKDIRDISIMDLVGRESVDINQEGIRNFIEGQTVLVTGGGGSIGSEICRQIMAQNPKVLIIFDIYENNAYSIQQELNSKYDPKKIVALIGSVRDYARVEAVFEKYKPDIVYHAAAHKHVPLMEESPAEAIKNNCLGTWNVAKLAHKHLTKDFLLISTDKAVKPTNVMGASKRLCEMIIQLYSGMSATRFEAVRFGNVLGSNGSVVPLFINQIESGGPVTVTDRKITRFFMTIPEAVSLVLQASMFAEGGEIFVLDMGKPVNIYKLAENLIRLKGYKPHEDIEIKIVGLRPGEKLKEEILMAEEGLEKTENDLIFVGKPLNIDKDIFEVKMRDLLLAANNNDPDIKIKLANVCETYVITENKKIVSDVDIADLETMNDMI